MKNTQEVRVATQQARLRPNILLLLVAVGLFACADENPPEGGSTEPSLSFFVTSVGTGSIGGDVGGLAGADALHENGIPRLLWGATEDPDGEGLVIDENGVLVPLTEHDIVTGSTTAGTLSEGRTCLDWTSASEGDVAQVGHSDIAPPDFTIEGVDIQSWNSAHATVSCTEPGLAELRGAGRFYCFAID